MSVYRTYSGPPLAGKLIQSEPATASVPSVSTEDSAMPDCSVSSAASPGPSVGSSTGGLGSSSLASSATHAKTDTEVANRRGSECFIP